VLGPGSGGGSGSGAGSSQISVRRVGFLFRDRWAMPPPSTTRTPACRFPKRCSRPRPQACTPLLVAAFGDSMAARVDTERAVLADGDVRGIVVRPGLVYGRGGNSDLRVLIDRARAAPGDPARRRRRRHPARTGHSDHLGHRLRRPQRGSPRDPRPPRRHLPLRLGRLLALLTWIDACEDDGYAPGCRSGSHWPLCYG
jgi:hypothetical protein